MFAEKATNIPWELLGYSKKSCLVVLSFFAKFFTGKIRGRQRCQSRTTQSYEFIQPV